MSLSVYGELEAWQVQFHILYVLKKGETDPIISEILDLEPSQMLSMLQDISSLPVLEVALATFRLPWARNVLRK